MQTNIPGKFCSQPLIYMLTEDVVPKWHWQCWRQTNSVKVKVLKVLKVKPVIITQWSCQNLLTSLPVEPLRCKLKPYLCCCAFLYFFYSDYQPPLTQALPRTVVPIDHCWQPAETPKKQNKPQFVGRRRRHCFISLLQSHQSDILYTGNTPLLQGSN